MAVDLWNWQVAMMMDPCEECNGANNIDVAVLVDKICNIWIMYEFWAGACSKSDLIYM